MFITTITLVFILNDDISILDIKSSHNNLKECQNAVEYFKSEAKEQSKFVLKQQGRVISSTMHECVKTN